MKTFFLPQARPLFCWETPHLAGPIDDIVAQFQSYGYQSIEIEQNGNIVTIEGKRDGTEREIVYDASTNTIVKDETSAGRLGCGRYGQHAG